jgi:hypothetical protein
MTIKFTGRLMLVSGIYGLAVVTPLLFLEQQLSQRFPPAITHPELYYGFVWVTLAWQIAYLIMSRDPLRFRPMLIPAIVGKAGFATSVFVLAAKNRIPTSSIGLAPIDLILAALFIWAFVALGKQTTPVSRTHTIP